MLTEHNISILLVQGVIKIKLNTSGFTLIELIIVLAIVAIISAILIPNFLNTTDRARLRSDIQSARVLQNALELHNMEQATILTGDINHIITILNNLGYIEERRVSVQTGGAVFALDPSGNIRLNIAGAYSDNVRTSLYSQLSDAERHYVTGGVATVSHEF